ncbi:hypothetical protein ACL7TT_11675 [Microbulbifer sp. 2304DJ12-6]|uniref:hypothetical protein n=1 Tax=Microbulbifer sp. 2304DJ12-6 TaxID=3233340 RepID=UPI0039AF7F49
MAEIRYTATREHVSGSPELITTNLMHCERECRTEGKEHIALSGYTESTLYRIDTEWKITTAPFDPDQLPYWREFGASCANGETFELDISDITGGHSTPFFCRLKRNSYKENRHEHFWFQIALIAVEV